ncbi:MULTISPECIES: hypothetical protein [unclassified Frigoribacterium]|uniref:hypothetical protein n=1 Tax=unclassified Frigoribacterium TaxID=2627005 RepID=UPI001AE8AEAC|nr:hypothetical protein [Frigoribacterium sp. PvP121]MBP1241343.1 hypothetical protein [Frigoribacterium sp. PvP121]
MTETTDSRLIDVVEPSPAPPGPGVVDGLVGRTRQVRDGAATVALATGTGWSLVHAVTTSWGPFLRERALQHELSHFGPFLDPGVVLALLWAAAVAVGLAGRWGIARGWLAVALLLCLVLPVTGRDGFDLGWDGPTSTTLGFLGACAIVAMVGTPRSPRLVVGGTVAVTVLTAAVALSHGLGQTARGWFWSGPLQAGTLLLLMLAALVAAIVLARRRRTTAAAVVVVSLAPWAAVYAVDVLAASQDPAVPLPTALLAAALPLAALLTPRP